jgi:RES domain
VPEAHIVNAAFTHAGPFGGRFHGSQRGAWYAGFEIQNLIAEVAFHKRRFLADGRIHGQHAFDYVEFLADFSGWFHTLDRAEQDSCLQPDPVPQCYSSSQALANKLLFEGSNGIVYPSVRRPAGTCIACFRPALVFHPRRGKKYWLTVEPGTDTVVSEVIPD